MTVDDEDFFSDLGYDTEKEVTVPPPPDYICRKNEIIECLSKYQKNLGFKDKGCNESCSRECKSRFKRFFTRESSRYYQDLCIDYLRSHIDDLREHFEKNELPIESIKLTRETKEKNCTYTLEIEIEQ